MSRFFEVLFRIVSVVAGIIFSIIGVFLLTLLISLATGTFWPAFESMAYSLPLSLPEILDFWLPNIMLVNIALTGVLLFVGIPLLLLITFGISMVFNITSTSRSWKMTALLLWILGLGLILFSIFAGIYQVTI